MELEERDRSAPVRATEKVSEVVARRIVKEIVASAMAPGSMLPGEAEMLARFQVGRASLREALRILEINGIVVIKSGPRGGPIVAEPDGRDFGRMATLHFEMSGATFRELVETRLVLEPMMARRAAVRNDPEVVDHLRKMIDQAREYAKDPSAYIRVTTDFHAAIAGASGNRILDLLGRGIKEVYNERISGMVVPDRDSKRIIADHEKIVNAIEAGDAGEAERLMREHMDEFARRVTRRYPGMLDEIVDWR